jgi:hypothetical protein
VEVTENSVTTCHLSPVAPGGSAHGRSLEGDVNRVELVDPEGLPLARVTIGDTSLPAGEASLAAGGSSLVHFDWTQQTANVIRTIGLRHGCFSSSKDAHEPPLPSGF